MNSQLELFDSHCHLHYDYAPKSVGDLVSEASKENIQNFLTVCVDLESYPAMLALSEKNPSIYHSVGVHPHEAKSFKEADLAFIEKASHHPKCRAIGELGMDFHYDLPHKDEQVKALSLQLDLAAKRKLPVIIHSRECEDDLLPLLAEYAKKATIKNVGVIHCFTGTLEFAKSCIDLGFFISFSGILTFKNSEPLRDVARHIPLDKCLVETDSPYLAPIPYRGKKCEPVMVKQTALKLAEIKSVSFEEVAKITTRNAKALFDIESSY